MRELSSEPHIPVDLAQIPHEYFRVGGVVAGE
jgi:hypothetical protein